MTVFPPTAAGARGFATAVGLHAPDIFEVLEQDEWWIQKNGDPVRLLDMDASHRRNTLALLRRARWWSMHFAMSLRVLGTLNGEMALEIAENELERESDEILEDQSAWLESKPLVKRLVLLVAMDERKRRMFAGGPDWFDEDGPS